MTNNYNNGFTKKIGARPPGFANSKRKKFFISKKLAHNHHYLLESKATMSSRSPSPVPEEKTKSKKDSSKSKKTHPPCQIVSLIPEHWLMLPIERLHSTCYEKNESENKETKKRKPKEKERKKKTAKKLKLDSSDEEDDSDEEFDIADVEDEEDEDDDDYEEKAQELPFVLTYDEKEYVLKSCERRSFTPIFAFGPCPESNKKNWFGLCYATISNIRIAIVPDKTSLIDLVKPTTFESALDFLAMWKDNRMNDDDIYDWPILSGIEMNGYRLLIQQPENWRRIGRLVQLTNAIGLEMCSMTDLIMMFLNNEKYCKEFSDYFSKHVVKGKDICLTQDTTLAEVLYMKSKFFAPNAMISFRK